MSSLSNPVAELAEVAAQAPSKRHSIQMEEHVPGRKPTVSTMSSVSSSVISSQAAGAAAANSGHHHHHDDEELGSLLGHKHTLAQALHGNNDVQIHNKNASPYRYAENGDKGYRVKLATTETDEAEAADIQKHVQIGMWLSLIINVVLFLSKTYATIVSGSLAVAASTVDSFLDLLSQIIVYWAEAGTRKKDTSLYPAGKARLEPVGIILCAALMGVASLELIFQSGKQLVDGFHNGNVEDSVVFDTLTMALLISTIVSKIFLWAYCGYFAKYSGTAMTLAVDHRNDVLSNFVAVTAAFAVVYNSHLWYLDPAGAILMSIYICHNWYEIGREQMEQLVGKAATTEFLNSLRDLASDFHPKLIPDIIRAYHFGAHYLVELEVILPEDMSVREAHDISLALQQSIEQLPDVERCFVHVDFQSRQGVDEHDWETVCQKVRAEQTQEKISPQKLAEVTPIGDKNPFETSYQNDVARV